VRLRTPVDARDAQENAMPDLPNDPQSIFLDRVARRVKTLQTLLDAGLGVYLTADDLQRKQAIEQVVRLTRL
jgi:hypothetical protein